MMESPKMSTALVEKNPDDEASQVSDGHVGDKAGAFGVGQVVEELKSDVSNVNSGGVCVDGKVEDAVDVVKEESNLVTSDENGNGCFDKGTKCSEFGVEVSGLEHSEREVKENAVAVDNLEGLEDIPVQQADSGWNVTKNFGAMEIQVAIDEDGSFAIGDIVWCKAKHNIWWPALICDPSDVPKQATKNWDSEKYLVRHFGSKTMACCPPSHLKHFLEGFKEMSNQGKSKSFLGAIEKAAEEVGRRVKLEMSCSCISKEIRARLIGRNKEDFKPWYASNDTVARHFDPVRFLERVKNLARMSNVPDIIENVATRCNVSAYFSYFGHSQMFLRHIRDTDGINGDVTALTAEDGAVVPTEDVEDGSNSGIEKDSQSLDTSMMDESPKLNTEGTAGKGFESRERKKSKYLSFPFVDPSASKSLQDPMDLSEGSGKRNSSSSKRSVGKSISKFGTATSPGDLKELKVSPAQLLTELRDTSRGYFYLNGNTILNSTFDFFCEFRRYTFNDGDSASNWYNEDGIIDKEGLEILVASPLSEIKPGKKRKKSVTNKLEALNNEPTVDQVKDMSLKSCYGTPVSKAVTKNRKRKELTVANQGTNNTGVLDLNSNGLFPRPHENSDKDKVIEADYQTKKKKSELENGLLESNVERHFGGTPASLNANNPPVPSSLENISPANSEMVKHPAQMELLPTDINSEKKLENPSSSKTSSSLPDLNGNGIEPNSSVTFPKQSFPANMIPAAASHQAARIEDPPLSVIKTNLEMMTKMLEESGNNISPDMRAKLENDVQSLLKKITDMTRSS